MAEVPGEFRGSQFLEVGDARVCWRKAGEGPALVFLHGFPLSGMTWRMVVAGLSGRFTCYALDLVGLGESTSRRAKDFSSPGQGKVMQGALAALGVMSYALVGNDTGGWVARELALLDTEKVTRLALTNTEIPGHRPPWIRTYQRSARLPGSVFAFKQLLSSRSMRRSAMGFGGCFVDLDLIEGEFRDLFVWPLLSSNERIEGMLRFLQQMRFQRVDRFSELHGKLTMSVAFFWGVEDPTFPVETARAMVSQFPNVAGFHAIPGAKLLVQEEQPEVLAAGLGEFLGG